MFDNLVKIIQRILPEIDTSSVTMDTRLKEDLGFDSLSMMMMAMELEDSYGFKFKEFVKFDTVGEVCAYLDSRI